MKPFAIASVVAFLLTTASIFASPLVDEEYDRLDGHGPSGKKVNVIEWEGNLEIHVYPGGTLAGLSMKIDRSQKSPVMVIGYRFKDHPKKVLIRRAVLGIDLNDDFMTYKDPSVDEYDKIIVSNNGLSSQVVAYKLDPAPDQLYPDGHPRNQINQKNPADSRTRIASSEMGQGYGPAPRGAQGTAEYGPAERRPASDGRENEAAGNNAQMGPAPRSGNDAAGAAANEHSGKAEDSDGRAGYFNW